MADDFFSFDEALKELRLKEEELKRLVSEGEIRAFRDGETMRLRRSDVENLRSELGGEVVDLGDAGEELVFEDDADFDAGMATEEISNADTLLDDDVEDVGEVEIIEDVRPVRSAAPAAAVGTRRAAPAARVQVVEEEEEESALIKVCLILTTAVLILAIPVCWSQASGTVSDLARGIGGIFPWGPG